MSDQSSVELEREARAARERVAGTAESIRKKLTAGQMIDEFADMFTGGDVSGALGTLKSQVRDNPLPVVLVGAGIAWLAFGGSAAGSRSSSGNAEAARPDAARHRRSSSANAGGNTGVGAVLASVTEGAKEAAETVSKTAAGVTDQLSATADRIGHSMLTGSTELPGRIQRSAAGLGDREPLLIAALGLTLGAVAGAMFPASEFEKEQLGPQAERLRKTAKDAVDHGLESASRVVSETYDALKEEADHQGLTSSDRTVGERVGEVVRSAAETAEDAARREFGRTDEAPPRSGASSSEADSGLR